MCMFRAPSVPQPQAVRSPTPDPSAEAKAKAEAVAKDQARVQSEQEKERFRLAASSRGLAGTILTSGLGDTSAPPVRNPQLGG